MFVYFFAFDVVCEQYMFLHTIHIVFVYDNTLTLLPPPEVMFECVCMFVGLSVFTITP